MLIKLLHDDWVIDLTREQWARILGILEEYGWSPSMDISAYYTDVEVGDVDASNIVKGGEEIQNVALQKPIEFYPVDVDMGILAEFIELCREGSFSITVGE